MDDGMREYLRSLQASIETQEATIEGLRGKNKRLEEKLLTAESYSEELRLQVQNLSQEVEALKSELLAQKESSKGCSTTCIKAGLGQSGLENLKKSRQKNS